MALAVAFQQERQIRRIDPGQTVVLEIHQKQGLPWFAARQKTGHALGEETGLAAAAHANHRDRLSGNRRQTNLPAGQLGKLLVMAANKRDFKASTHCRFTQKKMSGGGHSAPAIQMREGGGGHRGA